MTQPLLDPLREAQASALETAVSLGELATQASATFARHEMSLLSDTLEECVENIQAVGHATTLQQLFDRQRELAETCGPRLAALANDQFGLLVEMQGAYAAWLQGHFDRWNALRAS